MTQDNVSKDGFRIEGNIEFAGDIRPIISSEHDLGSPTRRFKDIWLSDHHDGTEPRIHFGDYDFTASDVIVGRDAAHLAGSALQPYNVDYFNDVYNRPTSLEEAQMYDIEIVGTLLTQGFTQLLSGVTIDSTDGDFTVNGTGMSYIHTDLRANNTGVLDLSANDILPNTTNTHDIGSDVLRFKKLYLTDRVHIGNDSLDLTDIGTIRDIQNGVYATSQQGSRADSAYQEGDDIIVNNVSVSGQLWGPEVFYIDPAAIGDNTGKVVILGDLQVDGDETVINSTTVTVSSKLMILSEGSVNASQSNNSGLHIEGSGANLLYKSAADSWWSNKSIKVNNTISNATLSVKPLSSTHDTIVVVDGLDNERFKLDSDHNLRLINASGDNLFFAGSNNRVGFNTDTPAVSLVVNQTDAIKIPKGTTAQRPNATTPEQRGYIRYNTTTSQFEGFGAGDTWGSLGGVMDVDQDTYISPETTPGADDDMLRFFTGGGERVRVDAGGNVGIGTTSPGAKLEIQNSGGSAGSTSQHIKLVRGTSVGAYFSTIRASASNDVSGLVLGVNTTNALTIKDNGNVGIGTTSPSQKLDVNGNVVADDLYLSGKAQADTYQFTQNSQASGATEALYRPTTGEIAFKTNSAEAMRIDSGGNVGIGTPSPGHKLEVKTPGGKYGCHILDDQGGSLGGLFVSEQGAAADGLELYLKKPAGTTKVRISAVDDNPTYFNAGNVGIGTDSPGKNLHIKEQATVGHGIFLENDEGIVRQILGTASDATDPSLRIRSDSTTIMTLMDTGNVGIGTTSPGGKLTIAGDMYLGTYNSPISTSNKMYYIKSSPFAWPDAANNEIASIGIGAESGGSDDGLITFNTATNVNTTRVENEAMRIASTGNVGIGTTSPIGPLHVSSVGSNTINLTRKIDIRGIAGGAASKIQGGALVDATTPSMGGAIGFALLDSDGTSAGTNTEGYLYFETKDSGGGLTEKVRITSSGRVGIGESNPGSILDIHDPTSAATTLTLGRSGEVPTIKAGGANTDLRLEAVGPGGWLDLRTNNSTKMRVMPNGRVGIGSVNPGATLDVPIPTGGSKITKFGNDITSHYVVTGQANHTLTFACGSYFQAEVVITAHQSNSGNSNNTYIRGIWSNNYTNHEWNELENVGSMTNSALIITNTHNGGDEQNGKLTIQHNYTSGSFEKMTVRITEFYGASHTYTLT
jgi:hypothetical protein